MEQLRIDVLAPRLVVLDRAPEGMAYAQQMFDEGGLRAKYESHQYPEEIWEEYQRLMRWVSDLARDYRQRVQIRLIDPRSFLGLYKSFRHWVWRYPSFIVSGNVYTGWERDEVEALIQEHLAS